MFTGIIQDTATIILIKRYKNFLHWIIKLHSIDVQTLTLGSSLACNGCCLTIKTIQNSEISLDIVQETLRITNLGCLNEGQRINVERSVRLGEEIGGHLVSGHILTIAKIFQIVVSDYNRELWIQFYDYNFMKYIFYKGFICIDGISLTIGNIKKNMFCVFLIPETISNTTIGTKKVGDTVNLEIDYFTKLIVDSIEKIMLKDL
ncbi:MAG: riboflavin synthase subunit alpha [Buchnera aphidicola (Nurudea yanoniella)]